MKDKLKEKQKMENKKAVVITTENRGVFFGYVEDDSELPQRITLSEARMCVYWDEGTKGVLGLASQGPTDRCRISDSVPELEAWGVTGRMLCSSQAIEAWERGPWR